MNKLVLKNPVLRFKLGKKIIKAKNSWGRNFGGIYTFTPTNEDNIKERVNKATEKAVNNIKEITPAEQGRYNKTHPVGHYTTEEGYKGIVSPRYYYRSDANDILERSFDDNFFPYVYDGDGLKMLLSILVLSDDQKRRAYSNIVDQMPKVAIENIINSSNNTGNPTINTTEDKDVSSNNLVKLEIKLKNNRKTSKRNTILFSPKFYGLTIGEKVLARGSNFNGIINDSLKQALLNAGFKNKDFNNVRSFLNALNNFFLKDGAGSIKSDNMWGDQTLKAFNLALSKAGYVAKNDNLGNIQERIIPSVLDTYKQNRLAGLQALGAFGTMKKPEILTIPKEGISNFTPFTPSPVRSANYNRSQIRNLISEKLGLDAYNYTGALRKALRLYLNGESNDTSLLTNGLEKFIVPYKQGGQLVSKNPVLRFKQKNFRLVAQ